LAEHLFPDLAPRGVPAALRDTVLPFRYNRLDELQALVERHPDLGVIQMEVSRGVASGARVSGGRAGARQGARHRARLRRVHLRLPRDVRGPPQEVRGRNRTSPCSGKPSATATQSRLWSVAAR
jgi:hypothetical protein